MIQKGKYKLKIRCESDLLPASKEHVYRVGFYRIECTFGVGTDGQLRKKPHHVLDSTYRIGVGSERSLILIRVN